MRLRPDHSVPIILLAVEVRLFDVAVFFRAAARRLVCPLRPDPPEVADRGSQRGVGAL
jgi:hypothetical protein